MDPPGRSASCHRPGLRRQTHPDGLRRWVGSPPELNTIDRILEDRMDTALNPAAAHRSDARLHVLSPSSSTSPKTLRVRAIFHLSEAGRRAALMTGGNGRRRQRLVFPMPASRMHLVHVDHGGTAFLKLRPRFEMRPDQRVVRIDASPTYDAPPCIETLLQDAARNHELEAAYHAQGVAYQSARQDVTQSWRTQVAESFLREPLAHADRIEQRDHRRRTGEL
jgi:hypothetical protein